MKHPTWPRYTTRISRKKRVFFSLDDFGLLRESCHSETVSAENSASNNYLSVVDVSPRALDEELSRSRSSGKHLVQKKNAARTVR